MAKDEAVKTRELRESTLTKLQLSDTKDLSGVYHYPSTKAKLKTKARLFFEDLVQIAENNYIELRNGKVAEYEAMSLTDFKRRPGDMFNPEELQQLYDMTGCSNIYSKSDRNCTNKLNVHQYRTIDGTCNNYENPYHGSTASPVRHLMPPSYENRINSPRGSSQAVCNLLDNGSSRDYDNGHCYGDGCYDEDDYEDYLFENPSTKDPCQGVHGPFSPPIPSADNIATHITIDNKPFNFPFSDLLVLWGEFVMNDVVNIPDISFDIAPSCGECEISDVCDSIRSSNNGTQSDVVPPSNHCFELRRSVLECQYNYPEQYPSRKQLNDVTAYLDASVVYGSTRRRSSQLRTFKNGLLKSTSTNTKTTLPIEEYDSTLNAPNSTVVYMCGDYSCDETDPLLFLHAVFMSQHNTIAKSLYHLNPEWNDELLYQESRKIIGAIVQKITYQDYLPKIFTGDYFDRIIGQYKKYNDTVNPQVTTLSSDILAAGIVFPNNIHRGSLQRNIVPIIIQRGRDHGVPSYELTRQFVEENCPSVPLPTLKEINKLKELYGDLENVDLVVGALLEDRMTTPLGRTALFGPTFACIIGLMFKDIREGDRLFYQREGVFSQKQYEQIDQMLLLNILCEQKNNNAVLSSDVFLKNFETVKCESVPKLDLSAWKESVCFVKINAPPSILESGQFVSISTDKLKSSITRVYANDKYQSCLPVACDTDSTDQKYLYVFLNIEDLTICNVTSYIDEQLAHVHSGLFSSSVSSITNSLHYTLESCQTANRPTISWECPDNVVVRSHSDSIHEYRNDPLSNTITSPDSMTYLPSGLTL